MLIPEVTIYSIVNNFLNFVASNYLNTPDKTLTILYRIFNVDDNGNTIQMTAKDNYLDMAIALFTRTNEDINKLQLTIGYNLQRAAQLPTIHILLPTEGKGRIDTIGNNRGADPGNILDPVNQVIYISKTKSKTAVYHLMITSPNVYDVLLIYYLLTAMFLMFDDYVELSGLRNLKMNGADLNMQGDLSMPNVFHRNLSLDFDYEYSVQIQVPQQAISDFGFQVCADFATDNGYPN